MATKYVWSGATGTGSGDNWENAYTALSSATGVAAGDTIKIHVSHQESFTTTQTWSFTNSSYTNPIKIVVVDKDNSDALATPTAYNLGITSGNNDMVLDGTVNGGLEIYGLWVQIGRQLKIATQAAQQRTVLKNCQFTIVSGRTGYVYWSFGYGAASSHEAKTIVEDCTIDVTNGNPASSWIQATGEVDFYNLAVTNGGSQTAGLFNPYTHAGVIKCFGCDFSSWAGDVSEGTASALWLEMFNCKIPASWDLDQSLQMAETSHARMYNCESGTLTVPAKAYEAHEIDGEVSTSFAHYRIDGGSDGTSKYSLEVVTRSSALERFRWVKLPPIDFWIEPGDESVKLHIASSADLYNDDLWALLMSPSEETTADAQSKIQTSKCDVLATPTVIPRSNYTAWEGSGTGTDGGAGQQVISFDVNPTIAGPASLFVFVAKPSLTAYIDPKPVVA